MMTKEKMLVREKTKKVLQNTACASLHCAIPTSIPVL